MAITNQYSGWAGGPVFASTILGDAAVVLTAPNYNVVGYPYESAASVIFEEAPFSTTPKPGSMLLLGSGIVALAGCAGRKFML